MSTTFVTSTYRSTSRSVENSGAASTLAAPLFCKFNGLLFSHELFVFYLFHISREGLGGH